MQGFFETKELLPGLILIASVVVSRGETIYWPLPGSELAKDRATQLNCDSNLREIWFAARRWSDATNGQFPSSFPVFTNELSSPEVFFCPADVSYPAATNWNDLDWARIHYQWIAQPNWDEPAAICCRCLKHNNALRIDGLVQIAGGYQPGWPAIIAGPLNQHATPGADVRFEVKIAPNASLPIHYQWRREQLYYVTNVIFIPDPDLPGGGYWQTNRLGQFNVTLLAGETNSVYRIPNVQTNHADYYSVTVSNSMGTAISSASSSRLVVDPGVANEATNEYWSGVHCQNNLKQIALLGQIWATDHNDQMPQTFEIMTNSFGSPMFGWPTVLFCRADISRTSPTNWAGFNFADTSYVLMPGPAPDGTEIFCRCKIHGFYAGLDGTVVSQPRFQELRTGPANGAQLSFTLWRIGTNVLEGSINLTDWTPLQTYIGTNGTFTFQDTNNLPRRFYRLRSQTP
jgi:hypothetical protein